jgi:hypothetical protein
MERWIRNHLPGKALDLGMSFGGMAFALDLAEENRKTLARRH